jgi:transcription initiation factor TFIIB
MYQTKALYRTVCPECGNTKLSHNRERGEITCQDCGLVIEDKMVDFGKEWREFGDGGDGDEQRRSGSPLTYTKEDMGLGTQVGTSSDLSKFDRRTKQRFYRFRKWQNRVGSGLEHNLREALSEIRRIASNLNLPKTVEEEAARIYTLAAQRGLVKGRSLEDVAAGSVYLACKINELPKTLDEISDVSGIEKNEVIKNSKFVSRELSIRVLPINPNNYISKFASSLGLSPKTQTIANGLIAKAQKGGLTSGKSPKGVAASALYTACLMCGEKRTQSQVADVTGVTEVTIRNGYKEFLDELKLKREIERGKKLFKVAKEGRETASAEA